MFDPADACQAVDELEEAQSQLASAQAALNDNLPCSQRTVAGPGSPQSHTEHDTDTGDAAPRIENALAGELVPAYDVRLRNAALQRDRDEWQRRAEQLTCQVAALREHLTAVCAEGRLGETALLDTQQASPPGRLPAYQ